MTFRIILLSVGLLLTLSWSALAQADTYILYSLDQDVTGDGVAERLLVRSTNSADPSKPGSKDFLICEKRNGQFVPAYRKVLGKNSQFYPRVAKFQWQSPDTALAGLKIRPTNGRFPEIWVVFTPSSDDFRVFQYNGTNFEEQVFGDGP